MFPMREHEDVPNPNWNPFIETINARLRFIIFFHLEDLFELVYGIFHKERFDLCLRNKDQEEERRRFRTMNLERFCFVLPLLVETSERLLPPFEIISIHNK